MSKPNVLVQLDSDVHASVFDSIVAIDAGVDHLLRHANVAVDQVRDLVFGAMFTRGVDDLRHTALFFGGSNVELGEQLFAAARLCFFGPVRVSLMLDPNGANTTAAAAVLAAGKHLSLNETTAVVLAGTGPVGQRVARLLAMEGCAVRIASRKHHRAADACVSVGKFVKHNPPEPVATDGDDALRKALEGAQLVVAAGAAGIELLPAAATESIADLQVLIDLNAAPPAGIEGVEPHDKGAERLGKTAYGAVGVGGLKMKIHKETIRRLFQTNDAVYDAEEIFALGKELM